jgi:hypothetical protein
MELGEVHVFGKLLESEAVSPLLQNTVLRDNGGKVVEVTSQLSGYPADELINGASRGYWCSANLETQTIILELGSPTNVKFVCVNPYSATNAISSWVRSVEVLVSNETTPNNFESVGRAKIEPIGRDHVIELESPRPARFVKILCLENGGGSWITAGEIKVLGTPFGDPLRSNQVPESK